MAASMTALGAVIWSDSAQANEPMPVELADDVTPATPVKLAKIEHKPVEDELLADLEIPEPTKKPMKRKRRLDFGSFEGY